MPFTVMTCNSKPEALNRIAELRTESDRLGMNLYFYCRRVWMSRDHVAYRIYARPISGENGRQE